MTRSSQHSARWRVNAAAVLMLALATALGAWAFVQERPDTGPRTTGTVRSVGEAEDHRPVRIDIPHAGVHADVMELGLAADGTLQTPSADQGRTAAWYDKSAAPGEPGPAVVTGRDTADHGPAVFHGLRRLQTGDRIDITRADGSHAGFAVDHVEHPGKNPAPGESIHRPTPGPSLRLIAHEGDDLVVYAAAAR